MKKIHIKSAKIFAEYADITIRNIKSLYLPLDDVLQEPSEIDLALKIKSTLEVLACEVKSLLLESLSESFSKWARTIDKEPFYEHYYRK